MSSLDFIASCFIAALCLLEKAADRSLSLGILYKDNGVFSLPYPTAQIGTSCKNMSVTNFDFDLQVRFFQWF